MPGISHCLIYCRKTENCIGYHLNYRSERYHHLINSFFSKLYISGGTVQNALPYNETRCHSRDQILQEPLELSSFVKFGSESILYNSGPFNCKKVEDLRTYSFYDYSCIVSTDPVFNSIDNCWQ